MVNQNLVEAIDGELNRLGLEPMRFANMLQVNYQDLFYQFFFLDDDNNSFIIDVRGVYEMTRENKLDVLQAVNRVNVEMHKVKAYVGNSNEVCLCYEHSVVDQDTFIPRIVLKSMTDLKAGVDAFLQTLDKRATLFTA